MTLERQIHCSVINERLALWYFIFLGKMLRELLFCEFVMCISRAVSYHPPESGPMD